jgi:hypothetical protein
VVHVVDTGVRVNGFKSDRDPIVQTLRYVDTLNRLLPELVTPKIKAIGIVVFPSYKVVDDRKGDRCIWVLEPKELAGRLDKEPKQLSADDVVLLTRRLASYIRPPS